MASSENQGLQAGLIISVILVIGLGVTTYLFYSSYSGAKQQLDVKTKEASDNQAAVAKAVDELNTVKKFAGFGEGDGVDKITVEFQKIKDMVAPGRQEDTLTMTALLTELQNTNATNVQRIAELDKENTDLKQINEQREAAKQAQIDEVTKGRDDAVAAAAAATKKFEEVQAAAAKTQTDLEAQLASMRTEVATVKADAEKRIEAIQKELANVQERAKGQAIVIEEMKNESFDIPHGQITMVNQRTRKVWVNLGSEDKLRRQVVLSVYPTDENAVGNNAEPKGTIEITNILDAHLAEGRIRDDELKNPIIPGDKVHTALWGPNETIHVALAGVIDINDDGSSDAELVRKLIESAGAVVDAEVDGKGKVVGAVTPNTTYLITGKEPPQREGADADLAPYTKLRRDGVQYGLKTVTVEQFLKRAGWKDIRQVINYARPGTAREYLPEASEFGRPRSTGRTSELFDKPLPEKKEEEAAPANP